MLKDYTEARDWLESFIPQTYTRGELGLERIENLLEKLGNPHKKFKSIHVAGTSGKGSTAFYTSRLLEFSGYKVGLHVSPHLVYIGERMQINGKNIPVKRLVALADEIKAVVDKIKSKQPRKTPSYFEILTALSFLYFAKEKVDFAVVEVGLGGRLDATNVLTGEVSVITNIGLDHTEILGDTITKIASEKAGIIKSQKPVVTAAIGDALKVIEKRAKSMKSSLIKLDTHFWKVEGKNDVNYDTSLYNDIFRYSLNEAVLECMFLAFLAVSVAKVTLKRQALKRAFSASFGGRFEEVEAGVFLDGAHNLEKVKALVSFMKSKSEDGFFSKEIVLVLAFKSGKKWRQMLSFLLRNLSIKKAYCTEFLGATDMGRYAAVDANEIAKFLEKKGVKTNMFESSQQAIFDAISNKRKYEMVLVTGSLYLVGEAHTLFKLPEF